MTVAPEAPAAAAPAAPAAGDAPIPQVSSMGAQGVKAAPAGTIPAPLRPFSDNPSSAMSKVKERLRNKAAGTPQPPEKKADKPAPAAAPAVEDKPEEKPAPAADDDEDVMGDDDVEEKDKPVAPAVEDKDKPAAVDDKTKKDKVNPWKLVEEHKTHRAKLEQENAELKKLVPNTELRKSELAEIEKIKQRNQELEKHIQFVDYQKSEEFQTKYEKPYKDQWKSSMKDLKGIQVETDDGARQMEPSDLVALVNMSKIEARVKANELFGDFANDVMLERDKIRAAFDNQNAALEEAKTRGSAQSEEAVKAYRETHEKLNGEVHEIFNRAVESISKDPRHVPFITPKTGDPKQNEILSKGLALVDEAFKTNPMDPALTPKQRESIVKKHAAVRFRSAGYGVVKYELAQERAAHEETKRKLAQYEETVPGREATRPAAAPVAGGGGAMARMQARLRARSK